MKRVLKKSKYDRVFTGVCGGFADYLDIDAPLFRILVILLSLMTAILPALAIYVVLALILPDAE